MIQPQFELLPGSGEDEETLLLEVGRITPVYESLGGSILASRWQRKVIFRLIDTLRGHIPEVLPASLLDRLGLPPRDLAIAHAHFPPEGTTLTALMEARHSRPPPPHLRRALLPRTRPRTQTPPHARARSAPPSPPPTRSAKPSSEVLPFHPTAAQKRVLGEIVADMRQPQPMRRLLQGDVGSGKTIVAIQAALVAIENGYQVALMAPTEILATQHYLSARKLLSGAIPSTASPTTSPSSPARSTPTAKRHDPAAASTAAKSQLVIGTHALRKTKSTSPTSASSSSTSSTASASSSASNSCASPTPRRSTEPDVLAMTATPIPRTLALTLYGDLDVSVIDELPPGRTPIVTRRIPDERAAEVWDFVRKQVAQGRQAYIVYPVIEGSRDDQPELDFAHDDAEASPGQHRPAPAKRASKIRKEHPAKNAAHSTPDANPRSSSKLHAKPNSAPPPKCTTNYATAPSPASA